MKERKLRETLIPLNYRLSAGFCLRLSFISFRLKRNYFVAFQHQPSRFFFIFFLFFLRCFSFSPSRNPNKLVVPWVLLQDWSETDHFDLFFLVLFYLQFHRRIEETKELVKHIIGPTFSKHGNFWFFEQ